MTYLFDTNAFLWMAEDPSRLPLSVRSILEQSEVSLSISVVSFWEIAIKSGLGKLELRMSLSSLVEGAKDDAFQILPIEIDHLITLQTLPFHHRDPFDRLIVAQALAEDANIVTADSKLGSYGVPTVW